MRGHFLVIGSLSAAAGHHSTASTRLCPMSTYLSCAGSCGVRRIGSEQALIAVLPALTTASLGWRRPFGGTRKKGFQVSATNIADHLEACARIGYETVAILTASALAD